MRFFRYLKRDRRSEIGEKCIKNLLRNTVHGMWKKLFEILKGVTNFEWLMISTNYVNDYQQLCSARGGNQAVSKVKQAQFENTLGHQ